MKYIFYNWTKSDFILNGKGKFNWIGIKQDLKNTSLYWGYRLMCLQRNSGVEIK